MQCASSQTSAKARVCIVSNTRRRNPALARRSGAISSRSTSSAADPLFHLGPRIDVGRVDRDRRQAQPLGRGDLVAHQRQQGRDDDGRSPAAVAQHTGRREVHGRLAEPGARHQQRAPTLGDHRDDRLDLFRARYGVGSGQRPHVSGQLEFDLGPGGSGRLGHGGHAKDRTEGVWRYGRKHDK